jgi:hypothetical protein
MNAEICFGYLASVVEGGRTGREHDGHRDEGKTEFEQRNKLPLQVAQYSRVAILTHQDSRTVQERNVIYHLSTPQQQFPAAFQRRFLAKEVSASSTSTL